MNSAIIIIIIIIVIITITVDLYSAFCKRTQNVLHMLIGR